MKKSFVQKHPYIAAILAGVLCTFMTALGMALPQILELNDNATYGIAAVFLLISVLIGIIIMKGSVFTLADYGFRKNEKGTLRKTGWYIPLAAIEILPVAVFGFNTSVTALRLVVLICFTAAVGFNEEIYFRGLIFKFLEREGTKKAIIWSSVIFGILHLANAFNGENTLYLILQMLFAFLVGFVLSEIVSITKSLWVLIIWHAVHDFISIMAGDIFNQAALAVLGIQVIILVIYAVCIWKMSNTENGKAKGITA